MTVYSKNIQDVRSITGSLSALGKKGILFTGANYESQAEYLFTRLNEVKPEMIEEATRNARQVAKKFAADYQSTLGKKKLPNANSASTPEIRILPILKSSGCRHRRILFV